MSTISVLIVNFNGEALLDGVLASVAAQNRPPDEVILVDNASTDGSLEVVRRRWPGVRLVASEINTGFAGGNNLAAATASGDYLALFNTDVVLDPGWLAHASAVLDAAPDTAVVVGKVYLGRPPLLESAGADFNDLAISWGRGVNQADRGQFDAATEVASLTGCAMLVRRSALGGESLFDERLFMYYEDFELALRLRRAGQRLRYEPSAVACHQRAASLAGAWSRPQLLQIHHATSNRTRILARHYPLGTLLRSSPMIALSFVYALWTMLRAGGIRAALRAVGAQARSARSGWRDRRRDPPGRAPRWLPWMTRHGLGELLALRRQLGPYVRDVEGR